MDFGNHNRPGDPDDLDQNLQGNADNNDNTLQEESVSWWPTGESADWILKEADREAQRETEQLENEGGEHHHRRLWDDDLELIAATRIRPAGWINGQPVDYKHEIDVFRHLESSFTKPFDDIRSASTRTDVKRDKHGISSAEYKAFNDFHTKGGHISRLTQDQIKNLLKYGIIVFEEIEIAPGVYHPIASVSALSSTPVGNRGSGGIPRRIEDLHGQLPNFDYRDVAVPEEYFGELLKNIQSQIVIWRSSVRDVLRSRDLAPEVAKQIGGKLPPHLEGRSLRRKGFAARGKDEVFRTAKRFGSTALTFNIGTIKHPKAQMLSMGNLPSETHNYWMHKLAWRRLYSDTIVEGAASMYWMVYRGLLSEGIKEFEREGGMLTGKGWDIETIKESVEKTHWCLNKDIQSGRHKDIQSGRHEEWTALPPDRKS